MNRPYSPLSGPDCIRLLGISVRVRCFSRELVCDFRAVPLDDDLPDYTAVSYCWGDQAGVARLEFSDGGSLPLSQTLSDLFRSLQKQNSDSSFGSMPSALTRRTWQRRRLRFAGIRTASSGSGASLRGWGRSEVEEAAERGLWTVTRPIQTRQEYRRHKEVHYETLLQAAVHREATEKGDMVFVFRGIADSRPVAQPEYTAMGEEGIGDGERSPSLLTWAPDLRHRSYAELLVPCYQAGRDIGGPLRELPRLEVPLRLRVDGPTTTTLVFGLDIDDLPLDERATPKHRAYSRERFEWLHSSLTHEDLVNIAHNEYHRAIGPRIDD
ncbi:hypothetical protein DL767_008308 [Monosporascus sp. MG133]|nr:hypothetical protein DL767_008308 [Monosporascus sp. MG133]